MSEMEQLIDLLDEVREEMSAVLKGHRPGQEIYPGWGMKEYIAHITGWEEVTIKCLRALKAESSPYILPPQTIDAHNNDMVKARADMYLEEVLREWEGTRARLKAAISELSEGDFDKWIIYPWGPQGTVRDMLAIIAGHEAEHVREYREM